MCTRANRRFDPFSFVFLVILVWQFGDPALAQSQPQVGLTGKNVLILHDLEFNVPILVATNRGLMEVLESGGINIRNQFYENLDFGRNPDSDHRKKVAELLRQRYSNRPIDLIVTTYAGALKFTLNEGLTIFPQAPIIALYLAPGIEIVESNRVILRHYTAVDPSRTLESAMKLLPKTKQVYVISGAHINDKRLENLVRQDFKKWEGRLEFFYLNNLPLERILATVSSLPANCIVFLSSYQTDVLGMVFTTREVVRRVSQTSNAPVFGLVDVGLGYGLVGGYLFSYELMGRKAGELGLEILRSGMQDAVGSPKNIELRPIPMFDWRQLKRWNLSVSALPKGSLIINRELTLWDFKYYIIGGIAVFLAQTLLVIGLLIQRNLKRKVELSLLQKTEELDQFFNVSLDLLCIASTDGYFLRLNPAWERILGYTREELMAKRFFDFVHPDDLNRTQEAISTLSSQEKVFFSENRYRCKDGTYRWLEWSSALVGKLIYAAARDVTERRQYEQTLQENERVLRQNENDLRRLAGRLISAQEEERSHLARELHDDMAQRLAVLSIDAGKLEQELRDSPGSIKEKLSEMKNQTVKISGDVHNLARQLHPSILDDLGLVRAIESECAAFLKREGVDITFSQDRIQNTVGKDISLALYRIVQEGLRNISKHACANHVSVSLKGVDQDVLLSIQDDGIGFDLTEAKVTPGLGLSSLRERVWLINGEVSVQSQLGKGTVITVKAPLDLKAQG